MLPGAESKEKRLERIAARAYELYEIRGRQNGFELEDWLEAEREIDLSLAEEPFEDPLLGELQKRYTVARR